ncbi:MAG: hypothetical protein HY893_05120 [Deltaproteobacteria bacterium]|nr:hypothetical protein [Deltaproteobacteria bacterium]
MKRLSLIIEALFVIVALASSAYAEDGLRQRLIESSHINTLYSIDDFNTLASGDMAMIAGELMKACKDTGSVAEKAEDNSIKCRGYFEAAEVKQDGNSLGLFAIRTIAPQPFVYKTPALPSFSEIRLPKTGRLAGKYSNLDMYEYMSALCKKNNGSPEIVITKRYGKYLRLTHVSTAEGSSYIISNGKEKDPWFFACNGSRRFVVEKDYQYKPDEDNLYFRLNRGLEGIDFVKSDDSEAVALLNLRGMEPAMDEAGRTDFVEEMAWEVANMQMNFVKTYAGERFSGQFYGSKAECGYVIIKQSQPEEKQTVETAYNYRVCNNRVASLDGRGIKADMKEVYASAR